MPGMQNLNLSCPQTLCIARSALTQKRYITFPPRPAEAGTAKARQVPMETKGVPLEQLEAKPGGLVFLPSLRLILLLSRCIRCGRLTARGFFYLAGRRIGSFFCLARRYFNRGAGRDDNQNRNSKKGELTHRFDVRAGKYIARFRAQNPQVSNFI
jgi:hypothetical protein